MADEEKLFWADQFRLTYLFVQSEIVLVKARRKHHMRKVFMRPRTTVAEVLIHAVDQETTQFWPPNI
jgi:hypothetical protein